VSQAKIVLHKLIQDSQDYGSTDDHMVSRVFFDLIIDDITYPDLYADLKQAVGGSFESSPIEVSKPMGYRGPFNYDAFRDIAEYYYRSLIGSNGHGIHIAGGHDIRMTDNTFFEKLVREFEVDALPSGSW
jgi:hypothetical protein